MIELTFSQLFQLYAPLTGLILIAFFMGALANRVKTLEREEKERKDRDAIDLAAARADRDEIVRMGTILGELKTSSEKVGRELQGVHRQLANIATGKTNVARELLETDQ